jgi:hypothetical protein
MTTVDPAGMSKPLSAFGDPDRGVEAQAFAEDGVEVRELGQRVEVEGVSVERGVEFGFDGVERVGVRGEQAECPRERAGGGLVAGEEEGDDVVADFLFGESGAVFVAGFEQETEQVGAVGGGPAAFVEHGADHVVYGGDGALETAVGGRGQPDGKRDGALGAVEEFFEEDGECLLDVGGAGAEFGAEETAADDGEGEAAHLGGEIEWLRGVGGSGVARGGFFAGAQHDLGEGHDAAVVENRLGESAVAAPGVAFGGEQAFACNEADVAGTAGVADVAIGAVLEHGGDERGIADEVVKKRAEAEAGDGALVAGGGGEKTQWVAFEGEGVSEERDGRGRGCAGVAHGV